MNRPVLILTGTTASGKNTVGAQVARRLSGEVVVLDSMKVYRGMDIGTAKPGPSEQAGVPHHLMDLISPRESMNLRRFTDLATATLREIAERGHCPVVVGGTQMYLRGLLHGVFDGPGADAAFREGLREEARSQGVPALHARLSRLDPVAASRIHENDMKRIERALEVHHLTGEPISELQRRLTVPAAFPHRTYVLTFERDVLDERIDARVRQMFTAGFVDEVRRILDDGGFGRESRDALGYGDVAEFVLGRRTLVETVNAVQAQTRRFARKQLTWLRKLAGARWFTLRRGDDPTTVVDLIVDDFGAGCAGDPHSRKGSSQS